MMSDRPPYQVLSQEILLLICTVTKLTGNHLSLLFHVASCSGDVELITEQSCICINLKQYFMEWNVFYLPYFKMHYSMVKS